MKCLTPGPNIPEHWYDGGDGWVTRYFTDVTPFSYENKTKGTFKCQVLNGASHCNFPIENDEKCSGTPCWSPGTAAVAKMQEHLLAVHNITEPPKREWASGLCDTAGCCDVLLCVTCQASRQMMAATGHANTFNVWWCLLFCLAGCGTSQDEQTGQTRCTWTPPCIFAAMLTRCSIAQLNRIDEHWCKTGLCAICCSVCSLAQSYREFSAAGVWPGGTCCNGLPPPFPMKPLLMK